MTSQDDLLGSLNRILASITLGIAALGGVSLFVGAVGILTIMTTTVGERTAEIGLLRAVGAAPRQVLALFLTEAVLLSLLGGVLGLVLAGVLLGLLHLMLPGLPLSLSPPLVLLGLLAVAFVAYWRTSVQEKATIADRDLLAVTERAVVGFAHARFRLPCPASDHAGDEDCSGGRQVGFLPWRTLGVADARAGGLLYGAYRAPTRTSPGSIWTWRTPGTACALRSRWGCHPCCRKRRWRSIRPT